MRMVRLHSMMTGPVRLLDMADKQAIPGSVYTPEIQRNSVLQMWNT